MASSIAVSTSSSAPALEDCSIAEVQQVFTDNSCMLCHNAQIFGANGGGLNLESPDLGREILGVASRNGDASCSDELLIDPVAPEDSLLLKLINEDLHAELNQTDCQRQPMPQTRNFMSDDEFQCVSRWVEHVAATQMPVSSSSASSTAAFMPSTAAEALSKAKYILHGGAPTAEELAIFDGDSTATPAKMKTLIEQWEQTPEYEYKLSRYFKVAFQVAALGESGRDRYIQQFWKLDKTSDEFKPFTETMIASLDDTYVNTALDIYNNERPFSEVINGRKWRVNTAVLAALAYTDNGAGWSGKKPYDDHFAKNIHFKASDFTDWRTITIAQGTTPFAYSGSAAFLDSLRALNDGDTITTRYPRIGFFNSPSFLGTWSTNVDNQFRVNAHQTVITALDQIFDPSDATEHLRSDGIPLDHAGEDTVCFQCHRHMDTMRLAFMNTQNINNHAIVPTDDLKPTFSFFGVSKNFTTMDELANILAEHPDFPVAWIQKLCMWGNSQRCEETDNEFKRIVQFFKNNNFNYRLTVREFFSSPLFTGSSSTKTHEEKGFMVSIARGDHLCASMENRLNALKTINNTQGLDRRGNAIEVCRPPTDSKRLKLDEKHFGIVPPDGFNRAKKDFVQVTQVGAFSTKSLDLKCAQLARHSINNNDQGIININQNLDTTYTQLVEQVMGLPSNHPRHSKNKDELKRIYQISTNDNACSSEEAALEQDSVTCGLGLNKLSALRNVFFAACTSPDILSMGM